LDFDPDLFPRKQQDFHSSPEKRERLSNGAGLKRNAADGLFTKPSNVKGETYD
jgi:hypothetical protein